MPHPKPLPISISLARQIGDSMPAGYDAAIAAEVIDFRFRPLVQTLRDLLAGMRELAADDPAMSEMLDGIVSDLGDAIDV